MTFAISSPAFDNRGDIPGRFTCDGQDISPQLSWSGVPAGTKSLALIVDDPDAPDPAAPKMTWIHWVLYDIPADADGLVEDATHVGLPPGTREGINSWERTGYGGPCPPIGTHRYFFKLYALDVELGLDQPTKSELEQAMQGHVLAETQRVGLYRRDR
jgi:Raf kinase inhibitor-like YbhB/YbcL family protein